MDLDQYLSSPDAPSVAQLRKRMCDLGYPVKSDAQIRQWRNRYKGRKPDPKNCVGIELATDGKVSRTSFYPDDWQTVWPELLEHFPQTKRATASLQEEGV